MMYSSKKLTTSLGVMAKLEVSFFTGGGISTGISTLMAGATAVEKHLGELRMRDRIIEEVRLENIVNGMCQRDKLMN